MPVRISSVFTQLRERTLKSPVEWVSSAHLSPTGDRVVVTGSLGRTEPRTLYIRQLDRPADGFRYEQVGSTPRVSVQAKP